MATKSDIVYDLSAFAPGAVDPATTKLNETLVKLCEQDTRWYQMDNAQAYRDRRARGDTPFPLPVLLDYAQTSSIVSERGGHDIPIRVFKPSGDKKPTGVFYHIHGGGWVLGASAGQDTLLDHVCQGSGVVCVSVEYRLAPEHPFPAGNEDCYAVAEWLVKNAEKEYGAPLKFIGGESAGGHLSAATILHLRETHPSFKFVGALLNYGCYDLSSLPSVYRFPKPLILWKPDVDEFTKAYVQNGTDLKSPDLSPAYANLNDLCPALFIVGTEDLLLDDTLLMHGRWIVAGNEGLVKFVPGAPHGFMTFDGRDGPKQTKCARQGWDIMLKWMKEKL